MSFLIWDKSTYLPILQIKYMTKINWLSKRWRGLINVVDKGKDMQNYDFHKKGTAWIFLLQEAYYKETLIFVSPENLAVNYCLTHRRSLTGRPHAKSVNKMVIKTAESSSCFIKNYRMCSDVVLLFSFINIYLLFQWLFLLTKVERVPVLPSYTSASGAVWVQLCVYYFVTFGVKLAAHLVNLIPKGLKPYLNH